MWAHFISRTTTELNISGFRVLLNSFHTFESHVWIIKDFSTPRRTGVFGTIQLRRMGLAIQCGAARQMLNSLQLQPPASRVSRPSRLEVADDCMHQHFLLSVQPPTSKFCFRVCSLALSVWHDVLFCHRGVFAFFHCRRDDGFFVVNVTNSVVVTVTATKTRTIKGHCHRSCWSLSHWQAPSDMKLLTIQLCQWKPC